jgi:hypothetical protein
MVWMPSVVDVCDVLLVACCHSDGGSGVEAQQEQYCVVLSRIYAAQQLNNEVYDVEEGLPLQFVCEIEVRCWRAVL